MNRHKRVTMWGQCSRKAGTQQPRTNASPETKSTATLPWTSRPLKVRTKCAYCGICYATEKTDTCWNVLGYVHPLCGPFPQWVWQSHLSPAMQELPSPYLLRMLHYWNLVDFHLHFPVSSKTVSVYHQFAFTLIGTDCIFCLCSYGSITFFLLFHKKMVLVFDFVLWDQGLKPRTFTLSCNATPLLIFYLRESLSKLLSWGLSLPSCLSLPKW